MTVAKSTKAKPYKDFPLTASPNGSWGKKIRGRLYSFGRWDDWKSAIEPNLDLVFAEHDGNGDSKFPETDGLRSDVYEIVAAFGLGHRPHTHYFEDSKFRQKNLIAFFDPIATDLKRGVKTNKLRSLIEQ